MMGVNGRVLMVRWWEGTGRGRLMGWLLGRDGSELWWTRLRRVLSEMVHSHRCHVLVLGGRGCPRRAKGG